MEELVIGMRLSEGEALQFWPRIHRRMTWWPYCVTLIATLWIRKYERKFFEARHLREERDVRLSGYSLAFAVEIEDAELRPLVLMDDV